jgi:hypothetical protein
MTDENEQIHHIRVSGVPESKHKDIYRLLVVKDPAKKKSQVGR